jgi:hypothetical protein
MMESDRDSELDAILSRYALRESRPETSRYSWFNPEVHLANLETNLAMQRMFRRAGFSDLSKLTLLEVGCGGGGNMLGFIGWGFDPANLVGNDLIPARLAHARRILPERLRLLEGDASVLECGQFDIVYQSTVFSSILDDNLQMKLARRMWEMTRPGGAVLWYDLRYDNPKNPHVRGVPPRRIRQLFPESKPIMRRVTLAPPISRRACKISPSLYWLLNALPLLRSHTLCWLPKEARAGTG